MMNREEAAAAIRYIRMERSIRRLQQCSERKVFDLVLTEQAVFSEDRTFPIGKVWDMSCRAAATEYWFLYLHTDEGVFAFQTEEEPEPFIETYRKLKN